MRRTATIKIVPVFVLLTTAACQIQLLPSGILRQRIPLSYPKNPHALFMEGKRFLAQGEPRKAVRRFRAAVKLQPDFEEARLGLALAYHKAQSYKRAHKVYREFLAKNPRHVQALEGHARTLMRLRRTDEARDLLERALAIEPQSIPVLNALAEIRYGQRAYREALEYWNRSLEMDPAQEQVKTLRDDLKRYVDKYGD